MARSGDAIRTTALPTAGAVYDAIDRATALRRLDPTEHNMERLNRRGRGSATVYQIVRVKGDLPRDAVHAAVDALVRSHELLSARIVADPATGELWFARGGAPAEVIEVPLPDLDRWPEIVEADMNRGATETARGPMLAAALLGAADDERVLVLAAPHVICDAISLAALAGELLAIATGETGPPPSRPSREILPATRPDDPMFARLRRDVLAPLGARRRAWDALGLDDAAKAAVRDELLREMEALEDLILDHAGPGPIPQLLVDLHALLRPIAGWCAAKTTIHPEVEVAGDRMSSSGTLVRHVTVPEATTAAIVAGARARGLTAHGPLGAAVLLATGLRHVRITGDAPRPICIPIGSPVSLRTRLDPPLDPADLRMAVDVASTPTHLGPSTPFWEIAGAFGRAVTREVRCHRPVTSWFATERRDLDAPLAPVPVALISNVGRSSVRERYGDLEVVDVCGAMATHGMFQIDSLFTTFRGRLSVCFYVETPAVSPESLDRFVADVGRVLEGVARGDDPTLDQYRQPPL